jgi:cytochrome oxidase Cu insertion factor (SCO1/SenC/PrrC family)
MNRFSLFLCVSVLLFTSSCKREPELTKYYPLPDFSLTDQADKTVTLADLKGRIWIADFIFTNCGGTCPMMTGQMRKLQSGLPADVRMVSITVDPDRDTPKALAAYAEENGATRDRWLFLTGDKKALHDLCIQGFKLPLDDSGGNVIEPIAHSTRFVLIDKDGQIRGYYNGTEEDELKRLTADAKSLL